MLRAAACVDESDHHALMYVWHGQTVKPAGDFVSLPAGFLSLLAGFLRPPGRLFEPHGRLSKPAGLLSLPPERLFEPPWYIPELFSSRGPLDIIHSCLGEIKFFPSGLSISRTPKVTAAKSGFGFGLTHCDARAHTIHRRTSCSGGIHGYRHCTNPVLEGAAGAGLTVLHREMKTAPAK